MCIYSPKCKYHLLIPHSVTCPHVFQGWPYFNWTLTVHLALTTIVLRLYHMIPHTNISYVSCESGPDRQAMNKGRWLEKLFFIPLTLMSGLSCSFTFIEVSHLPPSETIKNYNLLFVTMAHFLVYCFVTVCLLPSHTHPSLLEFS